MRATALLCMLLLGAGCYMGDRFATSRTVALEFPASQSRSKVSVSVQEPELQEALRVVDTMLSSNGFTRAPDKPSDDGQGRIVDYFGHAPESSLPLSNCSVYLRDGRLEVVVIEPFNRTGHPDSATRRLCHLLRTELRSHYGIKRVSIER